ncbi:MAG: serine/threonine protein kinase, partial [Acidiferrobacteraceae bacterium]
EGSALARVHHPNIVRVTNFFRAHNTAYMVMRYEEGNDLRWYIKRHPKGLSEKFIRTVFPPLLDGLEELHRNGLLHLDIKPANIFLRPGGNPLLLDFGAAQRACESGHPNGPQTLTFGFAPIEQHEKRALGAFTDLYAMGASMYACINGRPPPPAPERKAKDKYRQASVAFAHRYSADLLKTIDWCLEFAPSQRPQTVPELLDALKRPVAEPPGPLGIGPRSYLNRLGLRWPWPKSKP